MGTTSPTAVYTATCWLCRADAPDPAQPDGLCFISRVVTRFRDAPKRVKRTQRAMLERGRRILAGWVTCPWCTAQSPKPE